MVSPQYFHELTGASFQNIDDSVIYRILVLLQPSSYIVAYSTSIVNDGKMSVRISGRLGLCHRRTFSHVLSFDFVLKGLVSSFWEVRFFFQNGPNSHRLLKHDNTSSQIHAKIYHCNIKTFRLIEFLFNNKHMVVEELLQFFIYKVDGNLLKAVVVKHFKSSNIQYSTEVGL